MAANAIRNADSSISLTIRSKPENIPLPFEFRGIISPEKWDYRIMQINTLCAKYSRPLFERIWFVFSLIACIVVPAVLNRVIFDAITPKALRDAFDRDTGDSNDPPSNRFDGDSDRSISKYIFETRMITFAIFLGVSIVLWTPFAIWKRIGFMRARAMTTRWAVEDGTAGASFIPRWTITTPGVFNINGTVVITTPPNVPPTFFNSNAYLPPYITNAGASMAWAQQPPQQVPYNPADQNGNGAAPGYFPSEGAKENPFDDEKRARDFEDVKV